MLHLSMQNLYARFLVYSTQVHRGCTRYQNGEGGSPREERLGQDSIETHRITKRWVVIMWVRLSTSLSQVVEIRKLRLLPKQKQMAHHSQLPTQPRSDGLGPRKTSTECSQHLYVQEPNTQNGINTSQERKE